MNPSGNSPFWKYGLPTVRKQASQNKINNNIKNMITIVEIRT